MLTDCTLENLLQASSEDATLDNHVNRSPSPIRLCKRFLQQSVVTQAFKKIQSLDGN